MLEKEQATHSSILGLPLWFTRIRLQCGRPEFDPWVGKIPWRRDRLPTPVFLGFPCGSAEESACNEGDLGLIPGLGRSPGEGTGYPLKCSGLESSMDRGAWQATVHGIAKSRSQVSNFHMHSSGSHRELAKNPRTSDQRGTEGKPKGGDLQKPRGTSFPRRA